MKMWMLINSPCLLSHMLAYHNKQTITFFFLATTQAIIIT